MIGRKGRLPGDRRVRIERVKPLDYFLRGTRPVRRPRSPWVVLILGLFAMLTAVGTVLLALPIATADGQQHATPRRAVHRDLGRLDDRARPRPTRRRIGARSGRSSSSVLIAARRVRVHDRLDALPPAPRRSADEPERPAAGAGRGWRPAAGQGHGPRPARRACSRSSARPPGRWCWPPPSSCTVRTRRRRPGGASSTPISAFNNGGFDLFGELRSLTHLADAPTILVPIGTLIVLGGLGFAIVGDVVGEAALGPPGARDEARPPRDGDPDRGRRPRDGRVRMDEPRDPRAARSRRPGRQRALPLGEPAQRRVRFDRRRLARERVAVPRHRPDVHRRSERIDRGRRQDQHAWPCCSSRRGRPSAAVHPRPHSAGRIPHVIVYRCVGDLPHRRSRARSSLRSRSS